MEDLRTLNKVGIIAWFVCVCCKEELMLSPAENTALWFMFLFEMCGYFIPVWNNAIKDLARWYLLPFIFIGLINLIKMTVI